MVVVTITIRGNLSIQINNHLTPIENIICIKIYIISMKKEWFEWYVWDKVRDLKTNWKLYLKECGYIETD